MNPYIIMTRMDAVKSAKQGKLQFILGNYIKNKITAAFALLVILGGFYVFQINQLSVSGYELKKTEKENAKFHKEVTELQISVEKMKAAANLQAQSQGLGMVYSKDVGYVYVDDNNLAVSNDLSHY